MTVFRLKLVVIMIIFNLVILEKVVGNEMSWSVCYSNVSNLDSKVMT